jgi:outer membrane protein OmpA-like peptidoglycan-associated protein
MHERRDGTWGQVAVVEKGVGMRERTGTRVLARVVLAATLALALGACSNQPKPDDVRLGPGGLGSARGSARPGSAQDFSQNVGDIVYFSTDATDLSPEAQQTLANQARWLQQYSQYTITIEGHADERGTREYNIGLGAKRAENVKNFLARNGVSAAAGGGVQRHLVLVAESARPDSSQQPRRRVLRIVASICIAAMEGWPGAGPSCICGR